MDNDSDMLIDGADLDCKCLTDVTGSSGGCTANDVSVILVGLVSQTDGCINQNDSANVRFRSLLTSTATTRYDIGIWLALDGGNARTGLCGRQILVPVGTTSGNCADPPDTTCSFLDGDGPYFNGDGTPGDFCGEIEKHAYSNGFPDAIFDFVDSTTAGPPFTPLFYRLPCTDIAPLNNDGLVDIGYCTSWDQNAGNNCADFTQATPGTSSKCNCSRALSNVPLPNLAFSCVDCTQINTNNYQCTATYTNPVTCTNPTPTPPERSRCGTASFVRFKIDYDESNGTVSNISSSRAGETATSDGSVITWTPRSNTPTDGVVAPNQTATLSWVYTVTSNPPASTVISHTLKTFWSDVASFSPEVDQNYPVAPNNSCDVTYIPTLALISAVQAREERGRVVVEWQTGSEVASLGFDLYRLDPLSGEWLRVNQYLIPALQHIPGGRYQFVDPTLFATDGATYMIVEQGFDGGRTVYGPYRVELKSDRAQRGTLLESEFQAEPNPRSPRLLPAAPRAAQTTDLGNAVDAIRIQPRARNVKIAVREAGLYSVSAAQIATAANITLPQALSYIGRGKLRLSHRGQVVAWMPVTNADSILFYGQPIDSVFTRDNVYWLELGSGPSIQSLKGLGPAPSNSIGSFWDSIHIEQDLLPRHEATLDPLDDYWFWGVLLAGNPSLDHQSFSLDVPDAAAGSAAASLKVFLRGLSDTPANPDHQAELRLNGTVIGQIAWEPRGSHVATLQFDQQLLQETNSVEVVAHAGLFFVDSFEVGYQRIYRARNDSLLLRGDTNPVATVAGFSSADISVFDLSNPLTPRKLEAITVDQVGSEHRVSFVPEAPSRPYLAVAAGGRLSPAWLRGDILSSLQNRNNRARYLVITSAELSAAAHSLADYRSHLKSMVVLVEDIMDEFNFGISDPAAIRSFLSYAYRNWALRPDKVVLAGRGSYDYRDNLGLGPNLVPPIMAPGTPGLIPSDNRFADVEGNDGIPEMAIGRLPVTSAAELELYLSKIVAYENAGGGFSSHRVLLVADNPDGGGNFYNTSDQIADHLPSSYSSEKVYLFAPYSIEQTRERIVSQINQGVVLWNYDGHAGLNILAAEQIFTSDDIGLLNNNERLPIVTALTCNIGFFAFPGYSSLGEELVVYAPGGAAAVWAPAGKSFNGPAVQIGESAIQGLFGGGGSPRILGDVVREALAEFAANGGSPQVLGSYNLLGDPALVIQ